MVATDGPKSELVGEKEEHVGRAAASQRHELSARQFGVAERSSVAVAWVLGKNDIESSERDTVSFEI